MHALTKHNSEVKHSRFERRWNRSHKGYSSNGWLKTVTKRFHKATRQAARKLCVGEIAAARSAIARMGVYHA